MRPIRKKGVHRAIKRGEPWALSEKAWSELSNKLVTDFYAPAMNAYLLTENKLLGLSNWLPQYTTPVVHKKEHTIPIVYETPFFGLDRTPPPILRPNMKLTLWEKIRRIWNR